MSTASNLPDAAFISRHAWDGVACNATYLQALVNQKLTNHEEMHVCFRVGLEVQVKMPVGP